MNLSDSSVNVRIPHNFNEQIDPGNKMKIGTRKSTMALAQTNEVIAKIKAVYPEMEIEIADEEVAGDKDQISKLAKHGGKGGAFVDGIRDGIFAGRIQIAMHSLKDMPGNEESPGLVIGAYLPRDDVRDALVLKAGPTFEDFVKHQGKDFKIGTNSVRRGAQLKRLYPQVEIIHFRGAADNRIHKLDNSIPQQLPGGESTPPADGLIMAYSGLKRVKLDHRASHIFSVDEILPAATQGIVAVECAEDDWKSREILFRINDAKARLEALGEREVLWTLNGHCNSPIAVNSTVLGENIEIRAEVFDLDGTRVIQAEHSGPKDRPREVGRDLGQKLLNAGARALIEATRENS